MLKKLIVLFICLITLVCCAQEPLPEPTELLTKEITYDYFITEEGIIHVREITRIFEGDKVLSKSYHRYTIIPGDGVEDENDRTKLITDTIYTPEFIADYKEKKEKEKEKEIE